jgi:hypothetical protein
MGRSQALRQEPGMPLDEGELDQIGDFRLHTPVPPICPQCGYNLTGLNEPVCPECGYRFNWRSVRKKARMQWLEAMGLKTLPEEIEFGFRLTCVAWGLAFVVLLGTLVPWYFCLFRVLLMLLYSIQVFLAFCGAFLCSHVIRFQRLPLEAREELRIEVPLPKAWISLIASILLLIGSLPQLARLFGG